MVKCQINKGYELNYFLHRSGGKKRYIVSTIPIGSIFMFPSSLRALVLSVQALKSGRCVDEIENPSGNSCHFHLQISVCLGILPI